MVALLLPLAATFVAVAVFVIAGRLRDWRWLFFGVACAGSSVGAWLHHLTHLSGLWIAPLVVVILYATPLARIRLVGAFVGGLTLGLLADEAWRLAVAGFG